MDGCIVRSMHVVVCSIVTLRRFDTEVRKVGKENCQGFLKFGGHSGGSIKSKNSY